MGNLFSFSLPTTLVLLWACAPERAYNFQKYPRGCFSPDRRLKTVFQLSEQAINSKKQFPDWGTPPSTVQIHKTVRRRNLQTDQDRSRLPRSQMSLQRRGTRLEQPRSFEDASALASRSVLLGAGNRSISESEEGHRCRDRAKSRQTRSVKIWSTTNRDNHPKTTEYYFTIHYYYYTLHMNRDTDF